MRTRASAGDGLVGDVDHAGAALKIEMGEHGKSCWLGKPAV
jgi:hypothetical protein